MTAPASDLVKVTLVASPAGIQQPSFSNLLFLATHKLYTDRVRTYEKTSDLSGDGFLSTDPAYIAASKFFGQNPSPLKFKVGRRSADVVTITPVAVNNFTYSVIINGHAYTYLSDGSATLAEIIGGLVTAIGANEPGVTPTNNANTTLILTGTTDLAWNLGVLSANLTAALPASAAAATDLDTIANADPDFYGVTSQDRDSTSQQAIVAWAAANTRLAFVETQEANVIGVVAGSDSTTLPALEKAQSQDRSAVIYNAAANAAFPDVALAGRLFALPPGGTTAFLKDLIGITVDNLTPTNRKNAHDKNCNVYELQGDGLPGVTAGVVSSGKFIDQIIGRDWFTSVLSLKVLTALRTQPKLPFDDAGIAIVEAAMRDAVATAVRAGYIAAGTAVFGMPKAAAVSPSDKANRTLTGVTLNYTESGAIQSVTMQISVSV